jgi:uncharacterized membrane protein YkvA (DUF1232 family)
MLAKIKRLPWKLLLVALYIISPFDFIPESVFAVFGFTDDLIVVLMVYFYQNFLKNIFSIPKKKSKFDSYTAPEVEGQLIDE